MVLVMITKDGDNSRQGHKQIQGADRIGSITDTIAEADKTLRAAFQCPRATRRERFQIAMQIRQNRDFHP
jgi:hypothetical protein